MISNAAAKSAEHAVFLDSRDHAEPLECVDQQLLIERLHRVHAHDAHGDPTILKQRSRRKRRGQAFNPVANPTISHRDRSTSLGITAQQKRLLLFDIDGTLIHSGGAGIRAGRTAAGSTG